MITHASPLEAYIVTDCYAITIATYADMLMSGPKNMTWSVADECVDSLSETLIWQTNIWFACSLNFALVSLSPSLLTCHKVKHWGDITHIKLIPEIYRKFYHYNHFHSLIYSE